MVYFFEKTKIVSAVASAFCNRFLKVFVFVGVIAVNTVLQRF